MMTETRAKRIARKFNSLDFHDDNLNSIKICPPHKDTNYALIELEFLDDSTGAPKLLSFHDCGNIQCSLDFDVLGNNWFAQTQGAKSTLSISRMKALIKLQQSHWHVEYMSPSPKNKPVRHKLSTIKQYALFKITFFGGTIEILAKNFALKRLRDNHKS